MTTRRELLTALVAGAAASTAAASAAAAETTPETAATCGPLPPFPEVAVDTHRGTRARFYGDLVRGRTVLFHCFSVASEAHHPVLPRLAAVQALLGDRAGREVSILSLAVDADGARPEVLSALAARAGAGPGWTIFGADPASTTLVRGAFFASDGGEHDCSLGLLRYGDEAAGVWGGVPLRNPPESVVERLDWLRRARLAPRGEQRGGPGPRRPWTLVTAVALASALALGAPGRAQHPHPQPQLTPSTQTVEGDTVVVVTGESLFPRSLPFLEPPGTNLLPTVYTNLYDGLGHEIPNTLPSTPANPYNLHGDPVVRAIDPTSPTDDLQAILDELQGIELPGEPPPATRREVPALLGRAIDILEGNPVPDRVWSGLALLHYTGPEKIKTVEPILDEDGNVVGGNVDVHQVWYDNHIESDTSLIDPTTVPDVPWTVTFTVDVLSRGADDFSPYVMYWDNPDLTDPTWRENPPGNPRRPLAGMDQSFFPMLDGTRTVFVVQMAPGKYFSLTYTWGWRAHPPRVQVFDHAKKPMGGQQVVDGALQPVPAQTLADWEISTFGPAPRSSRHAQLEAIKKIGDLAPAKRMWSAFRGAAHAHEKGEHERYRHELAQARRGFEDWQDRTRLPDGVEVDPETDLTLLFVNNTVFGEQPDGQKKEFPAWQTRGTTMTVTVKNGDHFPHGYMNVDFGGARGWENQFQSSVRFGGSGCWFTFGRNYFWMNLAAPIIVPAAQERYEGGIPVQRIAITYNYDPSRRLRFYQFDPLHHDVAVFSVH